MSQCEIQTGVFVLKACTREAETSCTQCQRQICRRHSRLENAEDTNSKVLCLECYTKLHANRGRPPRPVNNDFTRRDYDFWYYEHRYSFFNNNVNFRPFDQDDYNNFDWRKDEDFDDDNKIGGFFDS